MTITCTGCGHEHESYQGRVGLIVEVSPRSYCFECGAELPEEVAK